jgi:hypothetical protein
MSHDSDPTPAAEIGGHLAALEALADGMADQPEALLDLLRRLESLHRTIQDGPFRNSLPSSRNALYQLLSEMEESGGWPYIPRLQLRTFMDLLQQGRDDDDHPLAA